MNKRFVSLLLALALFLMCVPAMAEQSAAEQPAAEPVEITVGSTNQMSGFFFTDMWGNNTADIDVRALLHAYSTVAISRNGTYEIDTTDVNEASSRRTSPAATRPIRLKSTLTLSTTMERPSRRRTSCFPCFCRRPPRSTNSAAFPAA